MHERMWDHNFVKVERSFVIVMCGVQLRDRKISEDLVLCLNETINQLTMINSVHWYGHVLRREDGHVSKIALNFEVEGHDKKWRLKCTWKKQVEDESMDVDLSREDVPFRS